MGDGPVTYRCLTVRESPWDLPKSPPAVSSNTVPLAICKISEIFPGCQLRHSGYSPMSLYIQPFMPSAECSKNKSTPHFRIKLLQRELFSMPTSLCSIMCGYVKQEAPKKQHCSRGGQKMKADTVWCYCINKHMPKEALQNQCVQLD